MITLTLKLLIAHILGDFVFQPDKWVTHKRKNKYRSIYLYLHVIIHAVLILLLTKLNKGDWWTVAIIASSHYFIDLIKLRFEGRTNEITLFALDQVAHLVVIAMVVFARYSPEIELGFLDNPKALLLILSLIAVTYVSAVLIKHIMNTWNLEEDRDEDSLPNGGKYIGILERIFVFGFIILNQWQAIGLLIAAKSVFRFSDLSRSKDRKLTEYILIGTLLSFGIAIFIGILYTYLIEII